VYKRIELASETALAAKPELMIWPETALPAAINADAEAWNFAMNFASRGAYLLAGSLELGEKRAGRPLLYNSAFLFNPGGALESVYRKQHLVPFGEYLPFDKHIPLLARLAPLGFSCSSGRTSTVFQVRMTASDGLKNDTPFATLICFEDVMPYLARRAVRRGARLLINQTNDAWFDGTAAAVQHLSHCVFRCIENRVPAVRCANTGVTCHIDPIGMIDSMTEDLLEGRGATAVSCRAWSVVPAPDVMTFTFYTRWGDMAFGLPCGVFALTCAAAAFAIHRRRSMSPAPGDRDGPA